MYCKYCGAKIDDDSIYCLSCGSKVENNSELEKVNKKVSVSDEVNKEEVKGHGLKIFLGFFIVLLVIICIFPYFSNNQNNGGNNNIAGNLLERDITKNDYSVVTSQDLTTYTIMVTPKIDIKYCEVHCSFYDGDDELAYMDTIRKENLSKNNTYAYTFNYGFLNALEIEYVSYYITGRCLKL